MIHLKYILAGEDIPFKMSFKWTNKVYTNYFTFQGYISYF